MDTIEEIKAWNIRAQRAKRNLNQLQGSELTGVPQASYQRAEDPKKQSDIDTLLEIARGYGVPLWKLFLPPGEDPAADPATAAFVDTAAEKAAEKAFEKFAELLRFQNQPSDPDVGLPPGARALFAFIRSAKGDELAALIATMRRLVDGGQ